MSKNVVVSEKFVSDVCNLIELVENGADSYEIENCIEEIRYFLIMKEQDRKYRENFQAKYGNTDISCMICKEKINKKTGYKPHQGGFICASCEYDEYLKTR